jgi:ribosomal protein S18 acetylase RimI-like enzyme
MAAAAATNIVKIKGLAADPAARDAGLGGALLDGCALTYEQLGYIVMYGQFEVSRQRLEGFYRRRGFDVLAEGGGIPMGALFDVPFMVGAGPGFRLFVRWR